MKFYVLFVTWLVLYLLVSKDGQQKARRQWVFTPRNPFELRPTRISPDDGLLIRVGFDDRVAVADEVGLVANHLAVII